MTKIITDAQGRKYEEGTNKRVYDKAGKNTWVEPVHAGTYPANHFREPGSAPFQLKEGDAIVDWMREVKVAEAPTTAAAARKLAKKAGHEQHPNAPLNQPDPQHPNGSEKPDGDPSDPATLQNDKTDNLTTSADLA